MCVNKGNNSCPSQLQSAAGGQMDGMLCSSGEGGTDGKDLYMYVWLSP